MSPLACIRRGSSGGSSQRHADQRAAHPLVIGGVDRGLGRAGRCAGGAEVGHGLRIVEGEGREAGEIMGERPVLLEAPRAVAAAGAEHLDHLARREAPELLAVERLAEPVLEERGYGVGIVSDLPAPFPAGSASGADASSGAAFGSGTGKASLNARPMRRMASV